MNGHTVVMRDIPSGGAVRVVIEDDGFVIVEGAKKVNVIYGFYFDDTGYHPISSVPGIGTGGGVDYIAVHTEHDHDGVRTEFSAKIGAKYHWWSAVQRAAMRLLPVSMMGHAPFFRLQFRDGGQSRFELANQEILTINR